jgi:hypothetical protein
VATRCPQLHHVRLRRAVPDRVAQEPSYPQPWPTSLLQRTAGLIRSTGIVGDCLGH